MILDLVLRCFCKTFFPFRNIEREEMNYLRIVFLLHRIGCPAVRYKFNNICCPADLKHILEKRQTQLESYKRDKKITTTQWDALFPIAGKIFLISNK